MSERMAQRIPVLVVSGFLGAGKTTLVRYLLQEAQRTGVRVAVISNEFGALGIDQALLGDGAEAYVELAGGCVCCQLSDTLVETLQMLYERVHPERIIVETSGIALPFDTQLHLWREPVCQWVGDDMAVVVVNAEQILEGRDLDGTFTDQVLSADLLLLNKIDLVSPAAVAQAETMLRAMSPETPLLHTTQGEVDPAVLFPPALPTDAGRARTPPPATAPHHHDAFVAQEMRFPAHLTPAEVTARLHALGALRAKGFVHTTQGLRLVQGVGRRLELLDVPTPPPDALLGRVVVIRREAGQHTHTPASEPTSTPEAARP